MFFLAGCSFAVKLINIVSTRLRSGDFRPKMGVKSTKKRLYAGKSKAMRRFSSQNGGEKYEKSFMRWQKQGDEVIFVPK